jgi:glycosyltransferase involved in cell wall biosynthesis
MVSMPSVPASAVMRVVMRRMARWDRDTAQRASRYVAISHYVAGRIARYYNREATVVYPPVDTDFFCPDPTSQPGTRTAAARRYALVVSALVPYKRIDLAIDACRAADVPLKIIGDGPERATLERRAAGDAVEFLGRVSDEQVRDHYRGAGVVLMPGEEDFGIVPLEAQACGRPVVASARGGALETVVSGETGFLVEEDGVAAFADAVRRALERVFDAQAISRHARQFGRARFGDEMTALVAETVSQKSTAHDRQPAACVENPPRW